MRFVILYESKNNLDFKRLKDVFISYDDMFDYLLTNCTKSYHAVFVGNKHRMVEDNIFYTFEEMELEDPTFDIWIDTVRSGRRISGLTLDEANELYDKYSKTNWVELQLPRKQFNDSGVARIKTNKGEEYKKQYNAYWKAREQEELENEFYSPSCPWNAPGMSIHDFI